MNHVFLNIALFLYCLNSWSQERKAARPNIVFIVADDMGIRDLDSYGSDYYLTPNLDRLARQGIKFTRAYSAGTVCSPTRASILTGRYPHRIQITDALPWDRLSENPKLIPPNHLKELPAELPTFAKSLRSVGYKTAFFGKWHLGNEFKFYSQGGYIDYGFEEVFDVSYDGIKRDKGVNGLTKRSLEFIEAHKEVPFLLYLNHHTPHVPLASTPENEALYDGIPKGRFQKNQTYAGMISHLDNSVQIILEKLKALGLDRNTVVIFTSDNGGLRKITDNTPYRGYKGDLYQGGVLVPLIVRWPAYIKAGTTVNQPVFSTDYFPTFQELVAFEPIPEEACDGKSMLPYWMGRSQDKAQRTLFWHFPHRQNPASAVMEGDWKLIHFIKTNKYELFNLKTDPYEKNDRVLRQPKKAKQLAVLLEEHLQRSMAQRMRPNPHWDAAKPEGEQKNYGKHYNANGSVFQQVKTAYPQWFEGKL